MAVAWVFPGQGSQSIGMALAWAQRSAAARAALDEAGAVLGFDLGGLIEHGPLEVLSDTYNQQPAVLAASVAISRAVAGIVPAPDFVAGHSLGEYGALVAAGALDYPDALRLVRERGRLMRRAGEIGPGGMAAVLGLADDVVDDVCASLAGVQIANYNCPGQVVISGASDAVALASARLADRGAKRVVPLAISIAAHSELMETVSGDFARVVEQAPLRAPRVPVIGNVSGLPVREAPALRAELAAQLTSPVRWTASVRWLADAGVDAYYEIGPGNVLCDLIRRTLRSDGRPSATLAAMAEPGEASA